MELLLDTHLLIWAAAGADRLPARARKWLGDQKNTLLFSPATLWEIAIKRSLNRPDFRIDARVLRRGLLDNGYRELPILTQHMVAVESLPPIHKDPFDRMLIAQAIVEGVVLLTDDATVARYPGPIRLAQE